MKATRWFGIFTSRFQRTPFEEIKDSECLVHPERHSVAKIGYDLETGERRKDGKIAGVCQECLEIALLFPLKEYLEDLILSDSSSAGTPDSNEEEGIEPNRGDSGDSE